MPESFIENAVTRCDAKNRTLIIFILFLCINNSLIAQEVYVDAVRGNDQARGTSLAPVASLDKAVNIAKESPGNKQVTLKLAPGLYVLTKQLKIESRAADDTLSYIIEALIMPDDSSWSPSTMPVIQSVSGNNIKTYFDHCAAFEILRSNVCIRGLKFIGNGNPAVEYYYAIERDSAALKDITVSQCYFIGDKNSTPIQGAIYMEGANTVHVDHCIFYQCKNAVLLFYAAKKFSLTHSIIYGAYESGIWYGYMKDPDAPIIFHDNIVSDCAYFWLGSRNEDHPLFVFSNSLIVNNVQSMGIYDVSGGPRPFRSRGTHKEIGIEKTGKVLLKEITASGVPRDYLHLTANSSGKKFDAGIFIKKAGSKR